MNQLLAVALYLTDRCECYDWTPGQRTEVKKGSHLYLPRKSGLEHEWPVSGGKHIQKGKAEAE